MTIDKGQVTCSASCLFSEIDGGGRERLARACPIHVRRVVTHQTFTALASAIDTTW